MFDPSSPVVLQFSSLEATVIVGGLLIVAAIGVGSYVLYKANHAGETLIDAWFDRREQVMRRRAQLATLRAQLETSQFRIERSP